MTRPRKFDSRPVLWAWLGGFAESVLFPHASSRRFQRLTRPSWLRVVLGVAARALVLAVGGHYAAKLNAERQEVARQLREELGRDPTDEEIGRRWAKIRGYA
jgi:hypothetical protein